GKTSQGIVSNLGDDLIPKGVKYTLKALQAIDYDTLNTHKTKWVVDKELNFKIQSLMNNFLLKNSELLSNFRRKKFAVTVGDELPAARVSLMTS
ncbi:hypothetical protein N9Y26_01445, partial [bacterium]|nr:hypothetical protein [bacterium]